MTNEAFAKLFKSKTKAFATSTIQYLAKLSDNTTLRVIRFQLIKSATSTAANY